jgi:bacillithiol system protein YtxJ
MQMIRNCQTSQDFYELLTNSHQKPVFLFKHSTRCPISRGRWKLFQDYAGVGGGAEFWRVLVIEDRPLSLQIARETGVTHQSPQAILFHRGEPVWHRSHGSITKEAMAEALEQVASS